MADGQLAVRVDSLEDYMKELSYQSLRTERELERLSREMREFKQEMRVFKDEMRVFKDEMGDFKDEMGDFKDEMRDYRARSEAEQRRMNRQWGELARKMGTMVEDLVAPNVPRIARELFECAELQFFAIRVKRRSGARTREVDALAVGPNVVLVNETKSTLYSRDIDDLCGNLKDFCDFFPEYRGRRLVGIAASLYVDQSIVSHATRCGVLVLAMGDDSMQILNPEASAA